MQRNRILFNINTSAMKQNEIATETLNINTSAMKQNEIATETLNIISCNEANISLNILIYYEAMKLLKAVAREAIYDITDCDIFGEKM